MTDLIYFAYGSNMSVRRLLGRAPSAAFIDTALLDGHALAFHKISDRDGSGKCDIVRSEFDQVFGVLYHIHINDKKELDAIEGLGVGYAERMIIVSDSNGRRYSAYTYVATNTDPALQPFSWYLQHIINGGIEAGLPPHYLRQLHRVDAVADPQSSREKRELSIYR